MYVGRLFLVDRSGQTQASIAVGEVGIDLLDPDSFALDVLGDIMNGFGGRLFDEIRSKEVCDKHVSKQVHLYLMYVFLLFSPFCVFLCPVFSNLQHRCYAVYMQQILKHLSERGKSELMTFSCPCC